LRARAPYENAGMEAINIAKKFQLVSELWSPKIVGELNGQHVKLAKVKGEFVWHSHEAEAHIMLFEPAGTLNTGNVRNERTREDLDRL
jgi:hypothetical protein